MRNADGTFADANHLVKHGKARSPIYGIWRSMRSRCENPKDAAFHNYGGRGITVCDRWQSFENFLADMGERPAGMSLDRIDNDSGYAPENCRWASRARQARNSRQARLLTVDGETLALADWSDRFGVKIGTIWARVAKGWPAEAAVKTPPVTNRKGVPRGEKFYGAEHGVVWSDPNEAPAQGTEAAKPARLLAGSTVGDGPVAEGIAQTPPESP